MKSACSLYAVLPIGFALSACATDKPAEIPISQQMHHIALALEQSGHPRYPMSRPEGVRAPELQKPVSWHWHGTLTNAAAAIAADIGWRYVASTPPNCDPVITIDLDNVTTGDLLDEIDAAGRVFAHVQADLQTHTIRIAWYG
ncbi:DotD/TraH family lipoprotein [Asaia bogorensis]|nr:DotD/TraH family lipoprotein [Asaia bogorensis]